MEWSYELGKSSDDIGPFDTSHTQTQLKITIVRFALSLERQGWPSL